MLGQYLKDTRAELNHVAWPTRTQTIVFTSLVVAVSIFISAYLGIFDYLFTSILERVVTGGAASETFVPPTSTTTVSTSTDSTTKKPSFIISTSTK